MLEKLFGNGVIEKILFYLLANETGYASQMAKMFGSQLYSVQKGLARLEQGGILVSQSQGKTLVFCFNPRYPFLDELKAFLQRAYEFLPDEERERWYEPVIRKRPRRSGKPLNRVNDD